MEEHTFNNNSDVYTYIKNEDTSIPNRSDRNRKRQIEIHSIVNLLEQFKQNIFTEFPAKLIHSDRPDFRIISKNNAVGIEVTEAIPEQLARTEAVANQHFSNGVLIEPEIFEKDVPHRTNDEIVRILKKSNNELFGPPSFGKSIEKRWIQGILNCVGIKTKKLNNTEFEKFQMNWLLIYDSQIRSGLNKEYVLTKLPDSFNGYFNEKGKYIFDRIIILSGKYFYIADSENVIIQRKST